jgi:signal transduction histidine kinase
MQPIFTPSDILAVLKSARLFGQFNDLQLSRLIAFSSVESFSKGDEILRQNSTNDKVFILLQGEVSVYADGEFILKLRRQGDLVGEMSVITKQPTSATVIADTDVELFTVSAKSIDSSEESDLKSTAYKLFLDILTEKLTLTTRQVRGYQATSEELVIKKQELARSEGDLLHKEAILQSVLGSMSEGVIVVAANGRLLHANPAFCRLVRTTQIPEDFATWPEKLGFFRSDETTRYAVDELPMIRILRGEQVDSEEIFVHNAAMNEGIWLQASSRNLSSVDGTPINGAVVVFRDFTLKKLEEKALIRAKQQAEDTARTKADFLSIMSHELRTPLNSILGMSDLLAATALDPEQQDYLETLKAGGEDLLSLIRNILDYSNLDSGRLKANPKPFSVDETLKEVIERHQLQADRKGITLMVELAPDLPLRITAYERGIRQTLRNLVDNAIKFSDSGTVRITVCRSAPAEDRPTLLFSVVDHGIGIAEKSRAGLFRPFYQLDATYSRRFGGTGIGLSVCRKYVEQMGGKIWVDSEPNRGSVFQFKIPYANAEPIPSDRADLLPSTAAIALDGSFATRYALRILVVEDNALNQKLILKILKKLGYHPTLANNGLEAVEICRHQVFDLVLMDLQMPEMDGLQASRIITGNGRKDERPVIIALTANASELVEEECYQAGMNGFLTKPLDQKKLARTLQRWA